MSSHCDESGSTFDLSHTLDCRKGGLVTQCHNEVRDAMGDVATLAYKDVICELIVRKEGDNVSALIADLGVRDACGSLRLRLFRHSSYEH